MDKSLAFLQGYYHLHNLGDDGYKNPYDNDTQEHLDFVEGYDAALEKFYDDVL